jgi:hypothetical protein
MHFYHAITDADVVGYLKRHLPACVVHEWQELAQSGPIEYGAYAAFHPDGGLCFDVEWKGTPYGIHLPPISATSIHSHPGGLDGLQGPSSLDFEAARGSRHWHLVATTIGIFAHRFTEEAYAFGAADYKPLIHACNALRVADHAYQRERRYLKRLVRAWYPGLEVDYVSWSDLWKSCARAKKRRGTVPGTVPGMLVPCIGLFD